MTEPTGDDGLRLPGPPPSDESGAKPWYKRWWAITAYILVAFMVLGSLSEPDDDDPTDEVAEETSPSPSPSPSRSPTPEPETVAVPDVIGMSFSDARASLHDAGLRARRTMTDSDERDPNTVVRTVPSPGSDVEDGDDVLVAVARERAPEPQPQPDPEPDPEPPPPPPPAPEPEPPPPPPPPPPPETVHYANCSEARAAGAAPVHRGDPGYASHLDRDGDGVGCEN